MNNMMKENNDNIIKLIKDYFPKMTEESFDYFCEKINTPFNDPLLKQITDRDDRRLFFEFNNIQDFDDQNIYASFLNAFKESKGFNISKEEFYNKKKDEKKIIKFILEEASSNINAFVDFINFILRSSDKTFIDETFLSHCFPKNHTIISESNKFFFITKDHYCFKDGRKTFKKLFNPNEIKRYISVLKDSFTTLINKDFFGKITNKKAYLCLSLNPADFILCSTENSWSSCINLESDSGYWVGLPQTVVDPNRILMYITDGTEKEFKGIKSFKMLKRAWFFLAKKAFDKKRYIITSKVYPNKSTFNQESIIYQMLDLKEEDIMIKSYSILRDSFIINFESYYTYSPLWYDVDDNICTMSIYNDISLEKYCSDDKLIHRFNINDYGVCSYSLEGNGLSDDDGFYPDGAIEDY